ncbi:hypothetical protein G6F56_011997 [Rhizopus delemar]|nr:hypothetical protein G6F56_011997 [Rhizopus delemar]
MHQFIFEDGYGNFCDEQGASVAVIDMEVNKDAYHLANITNFGEYMVLKPPEKPIKKSKAKQEDESIKQEVPIEKKKISLMQE